MLYVKTKENIVKLHDLGYSHGNTILITSDGKSAHLIDYGHSKALKQLSDEQGEKILLDDYVGLANSFYQVTLVENTLLIDTEIEDKM